MMFTQWEGFEGGNWQESIDVRDFIQKNYTPYDGNEEFLAPATERTNRLLHKFENLLALERAYRERYARNLTLSRLSEAVILPLSPDKGAALRYDANLSASVCLESDLRQLDRMKPLLE